MVLDKSTFEGVLVVDDDPIMLRSIQRVLGYLPVEACLGGEKALTLLGQRRFAVVLCDLKMPVLDGRQLYTEIRATDPAQAERFVFMTGGSSEDEYEAFLNRVEHRSLEKPFDAEALRDLMAEFELTGPSPQP